jgi:hypothetical protein
MMIKDFLEVFWVILSRALLIFGVPVAIMVLGIAFMVAIDMSLALSILWVLLLSTVSTSWGFGWSIALGLD